LKILISGGLGFIGHETVRCLSKDHDVYVMDSMTNYNFIPLDQMMTLFRQRNADHRNQVPTKIGDIRDCVFVNNTVEEIKPDVVIHLASYPRQKVVLKNPSIASEVMSTGLINLLEASKGIVSKFVYISSSMVYGDFDDMVEETHACNPRGQYAIMKYMGEKLVADYQKHFEYAIIRPSAVYGPRDVEDRVLSKFVLGALRGETLEVRGATEILDFTYSTDVADGIALAATKACKYDIYNITKCETNPITLEKAALTAIDLAGRGSIKLMERDWDFPSRGRLDNTRAIRDLGHKPIINFKTGCKQYVDWVKAHLNIF